MSLSIENVPCVAERARSVAEIAAEHLEVSEIMQDFAMAESGILNFELYVDDDRYSVPTLHLITAADEAMALEMARARLDESDHHSGVELWRDGRQLTVLGAPRRRA